MQHVQPSCDTIPLFHNATKPKSIVQGRTNSSLSVVGEQLGRLDAASTRRKRSDRVQSNCQALRVPFPPSAPAPPHLPDISRTYSTVVLSLCNLTQTSQQRRKDISIIKSAFSNSKDQHPNNIVVSGVRPFILLRNATPPPACS